MIAHPRLPEAIEAAGGLAAGLVDATLLLTLHRDIDNLPGLDGHRLGRSSKQYALRWAIFTMTYAATEAFFNDVFRETSSPRALPLHTDKLRRAGERLEVRLFTNEWGIRTRATKPGALSHRSRWVVYSGTQALNAYLGDMKGLRDLLSHGQDPRKVSNASGALWPLSNGGHTMSYGC